jgi:hypothetical protein
VIREGFLGPGAHQLVAFPGAIHHQNVFHGVLSFPVDAEFDC